MKRVTIQEARKLFDLGVVIYLLPSHTEYVEGMGISVYTYNLKDKDFDAFVNRYKSVSSNKMRYYVHEEEVNAAKRAKARTDELRGIKKKETKKTEGLKYSKQELLKIGRNVASLWGGECYDVEVDNKNKKVVFLCVEHGEQFATELAFNELQQYT